MKLALHGVGVTIEDHTILDGVELTVGSGRLCALVGPNGSGKSTLLRTVYRALRPTTGVVRLDDDDAWRLRPREAARRRAVLTQDAAGADPGSDSTAGFTVAEIVLMGRGPHLGPFDRERPRDHALTDDALAQVGLAALAERPFGSLSGGERQKVLLARALAQQAPLVLLDEPTNHLDIRARLELLDLVRGLGVTVLAALHDLDQAVALADQVAVLDRGHLVAVGAPLDVLTPARIEAVFGVRAHIGRHPLTGRPHIAVASRPPP